MFQDLSEWDGLKRAGNRLAEKYEQEDFSDESLTVETNGEGTYTVMVSEIEDPTVLETLRSYISGRDRFLGIKVVDASGEGFDDYVVMHYTNPKRLTQLLAASVMSVV